MLECNLFSYCINNPVAYLDMEGNWSWNAILSSVYDKVQQFFKETVLDTFKKNAEVARKKAMEDFGMNEIGQYDSGWATLAEGLIWFADQFKEGGAFDFKRTGIGEIDPGAQLVVDGETYTMEDLGNIHYGFVGAAIGIPETVLKLGSLYNHLSKHGNWNEDPRDYEMISLGVELAKIYYPDMIIFQ